MPIRNLNNDKTAIVDATNIIVESATEYITGSANPSNAKTFTVAISGVYKITFETKVSAGSGADSWRIVSSVSPWTAGSGLEEYKGGSSATTYTLQTVAQIPLVAGVT